VKPILNLQPPPIHPPYIVFDSLSVMNYLKENPDLLQSLMRDRSSLGPSK